MVLVGSFIHGGTAYHIIEKRVLLEGFSSIGFIKVGEDYERFMKWFLMPTLINGMYTGLDEVQEGSSLEVANEGLPKVNWNFSVYGDSFSHTYRPFSQTMNME